MSFRWTDRHYLRLAQFSLVLYLLVFQAWRYFPDYPAGVLQERFSAVGLFHLLPGPLSEGLLNLFFWIWPIFLLISLVPRWTRFGLWGSFLLGCYVLGYPYNYGRVFHGTSLVLQLLLVLAIGWPARKLSPREKEIRSASVLWFGQLVICLVYFSSAISKLIRSGFSWALTDNLSVILHTQALITPFQDWLLSLPALALSLIALGVLVVELTSFLPILFPATAVFYVLAWSSFHVAVYFSMGGHLTFFSHFFAYPFFLRSILKKRRK